MILGPQMRLEQKLTPQLIQSMDILQLNVVDLQQRVADELEKNVVLEVAENRESVDGAERKENRSESEGQADSFDRFDRMDRYYDLDADRYSGGRSAGGAGDRDAKMAAMSNTEGRPESLTEYLLKNWSLTEQDDDVDVAGREIIEYLEEDGYLKTSLEEIQQKGPSEVSMEAYELALGEIQRMEPLGMGARSYSECLLIQLDALPGDNTIERQLIEHYLEDIAHKRYSSISKATGYSIGEISESVKVITNSLYLHPGSLAVDRVVNPIIPDVIVEYADGGGDIDVRLTRGNTPKLRISKETVDMFRAKQNGKQVRDFLNKQLESANTLIDAIQYRQGRLLEVARAVVERQAEFFEVGPQGLKILRMADLAERFGCDPSTVSRTVADKYMQTPRGIFPLRYFFTGGTDTADGETSWDSVKERVREMVDQEDKKNPLKDDQIVEKLEADGITISRRTVAKYRQQMEILSARQRREY
jgi:RNA polymerase sigma-54 factor